MGVALSSRPKKLTSHDLKEPRPNEVLSRSVSLGRLRPIATGDNKGAARVNIQRPNGLPYCCYIGDLSRSEGRDELRPMMYDLTHRSPEEFLLPLL